MDIHHEQTRMSSPLILLIDDDRAFVETMAEQLQHAGYRTMIAGHGAEGLAMLKGDAAEAKLVLLDVRMPGMDGHETLEKIVQSHPSTPVIMFTGENSIDLVVRAMKSGATNYIYKGAGGRELLTAVESVLEHAGRQNGTSGEDGTAYGIIGTSPALQRVLEVARMCANSMISVLISGETGVGKDVLARAIHMMSPRRGKSFSTIDVPNIPASMFESELFGHTRGAFTGASDAKQGLIQAADGGTLFLDEIGEFPIELQAKFLHVLDSQSVRRLGSVVADQVNVRVVSATNRNLLEAVRDRSFREDLFYRLRGIEITIPPLRERRPDIAPLARHFLEEFVKRNAMEPRRFAQGALELLERQRWPGNIRELRRTVEAVAVMTPRELVEHTDVARVLERTEAVGAAELTIVRDYNDVQMLARQTKKEELIKILDRNEWNITRAAAELDIDRSTLSKQMKSLGIDKPRMRL
jgi:DNA-binding NtrC family response regulator